LQLTATIPGLISLVHVRHPEAESKWSILGASRPLWPSGLPGSADPLLTRNASKLLRKGKP